MMMFVDDLLHVFFGKLVLIIRLKDQRYQHVPAVLLLYTRAILDSKKSILLVFLTLNACYV